LSARPRPPRRLLLPYTTLFRSPNFFTHTRKDALSEADVVVVAGTPLDFRLGYGAGFSPDAKIVQIDADASEIGRNRAVAVGLVGDRKSTRLNSSHLGISYAVFC